MRKTADSTAPTSTPQPAHYKALLLPDWSDGNPYQNLLVEAMQRRGARLELADYPQGYFPLNRAANRSGKIQVLHLHWINELIAPILWSEGRVALFVKLVLLVADVLIVRLRGISVVWTIHNLVAHESPNRTAELRARSVLARACSSVILHSERARLRVETAYRVNLSGKCAIIPHGNYDGCYPFSMARRDNFATQFSVDGQSVVILFFGAIRPYKGVCHLIDAFRKTSSPNLRLIVAGCPNTPQFGDEIAALAKPDPRISLLLDFVPKDDVAALFSVADIVALPFENTLTSGSVILALTMGKPLLLPEEARVLDAVSDDCALFYDSGDALGRELSMLDKDRLAAMGKSAKERSTEFSWDHAARLTELACCIKVRA